MFYHLCNRTATVILSLLVMTLQINAFFFFAQLYVDCIFTQTWHPR